MVGLAAGILLRLAEPVAMLFFGTAVLGASIALANVLVPAVIKRDFPGRTGMMTGLYTMCLAAGSTLAAGLVVPLRDRFDLDWRQALALLAVPALVAVIALLPRLRLNGTALATATAQRQPTPRLWRNRLAWQVSLFMGLQSFIYFGLGSWIPVLLVDSGLSEARAGLMWSICNFAGLPFSFVVPILAQKLPDQRPLVVAMVVTWAASIVGVLVAPATFTLLWMVLFGMGGGAALSLALMFIVLRAPDTAHAASLSGMAQAIGYTLAAFAPFLFGALHDLTGDWQVSVGMILLALVPTLAAGWQAGQRRLVAPLPGPLGIPGGDR
jgi:CP family cyanate transporter-like MFS transporter